MSCCAPLQPLSLSFSPCLPSPLSRSKVAYNR